MQTTFVQQVFQDVRYLDVSLQETEYVRIHLEKEKLFIDLIF